MIEARARRSGAAAALGAGTASAVLEVERELLHALGGHRPADLELDESLDEQGDELE